MDHPIPDSIPLEVYSDIVQRLHNLERNHNIKILLACEVGSRAWGLSSPSSDYDIKFIYVRPLSWYLSIDEKMRDLIDDASEKEYDMNGWDIRKALQLLRESNCSILEWINSNFCYLKNQEFVDSLRSLASKHHCRKSLIMAYWSKASKHYKDYINIENSEVILKKYLFVVQGITSAFWIIAHSPNGTDLPPQHFGALIDSLVGTSYQLPENIFTISKSLMQQKIAGQLQNGPRVAELDNWVIDSLAQIEAFTRPLEKRSRQVGMSPFNDVLLSTVTKLSGYAKIDSPSEYFFDKS